MDLKQLSLLVSGISRKQAGFVRPQVYIDRLIIRDFWRAFLAHGGSIN